MIADVVENFEFSGLKIDAAARTISRDGVQVHLTPKKYDLLLPLVRNSGRVFTPRQLLTAIWGAAHSEDVQ